MKSGIIGLVGGFLNGLFGAGGGTILVPSMEKFLGLEEHKAHATAISIILPLSVISLVVYWYKGELIWQSALMASIGGVLGGAIGAKFLSKISGKWLRCIFGVFMVIAGGRMFF